MKVRTSFVTNSSSSSFVYTALDSEMDPTQLSIGKGWKIETKEENGVNVLDMTTFSYDFGWSFTRYSSVEDKFAYAVTCIANWQDYEKKRQRPKFERYRKPQYEWDISDAYLCETTEGRILQNCLKKYLNLDVDVVLMNSSMDHQMYEDGGQEEMFANEDNLAYFLFSANSYVDTGNDNSDPPDWWGDSED